jgi:hypothetical protein
MVRLGDPVFEKATVTSDFATGHDVATLKTYRYLRIGMLVAAAALGYAIVEEGVRPSVDCLLGSISGYYYTPVHPIFIGVMVVIGAMLIAIKGRTVVEDAFLSLAGLMAPIVAFVPTTDDKSGVCRSAMLDAGRYESGRDLRVISASISNNLHTLLFAGYLAVVLVVLAAVIQRRVKGSLPEWTTGTWVGLGITFVVLLIGSALLHWSYDWVIKGHAVAACLMFLFLALAAGTNCVNGFVHDDTKHVYAWIYGIVGIAMVVAGVLFLIERAQNRSALGGHLVLTIEAAEIILFVVFWTTQTAERWNQTV